MTIGQFLYRRLFIEKYFNFVYNIMRRRKYITDQTMFMDYIKVSLLYQYLEMILMYYNDNQNEFTSDDNMFTVVEIKGIINTFNDITGSTICYQAF